MQSKLGLDFKRVHYARELASGIASNVQEFVESFTTVAVERTLCRMAGIDGTDSNEVPLPNIMTDFLKERGVINQGVLFYIANAMVNTGLSPQEIAEKVSSGQLDITTLPVVPKESISEALRPVIEQCKIGRAHV